MPKRAWLRSVFVFVLFVHVLPFSAGHTIPASKLAEPKTHTENPKLTILSTTPADPPRQTPTCLLSGSLAPVGWTLRYPSRSRSPPSPCLLDGGVAEETERETVHRSKSRTAWIVAGTKAVREASAELNVDVLNVYSG